MPDTTPTITAGSQFSLNEANLPNGTHPGASPLTAQGAFFIQASDGIVSATIDGHSFISNGAFTPITDTTPLGEQIALQGYDASTGKVTFAYTLQQAVHHDHPASPTVNAFSGHQPDAPVIVATGNDGVQATGTVGGIDILDDAPVAGSNTNFSVIGSTRGITGNVFTGAASNGSGTATVFGADGGAHIVGTNADTTGAGQIIGSFSFSAAGDYSFAINHGVEVGAQEIMRVAVADADGSGAVVNLRIVAAADDNGDLIHLASNPSKIGGGGDDTLVATSGGTNTLTGGAGHDLFQPDQFAKITDFVVGTDHLDLSKVLGDLSPAYQGSDPVADGYVSLVSDGAGGTNIMVDGDGPHGAQAAHAVADLVGVDPNAVTYAQLVNGPLPPPPPAGQVLTADGTMHQALSGTAGSDTINAGQNSVSITTGGGNDIVVFDKPPFNPGDIRDFVVGEDHLNVTGLLQSVGYTGSDPVGDGYITINVFGHGDTQIVLDPDGPHGSETPRVITTLDGVMPAGLSGSEILTSNGSGATASPPPPPVSPPPVSPPPVSPPPPGGGQVLTADDSPGQHLTGGDGADTLNAGHNSVVETGGGGADLFAFGAVPWNAGQITDFTLGTDHLDLSALFRASGYSGSDPIADGFVSLVADGSGGTNVLYDTDGRASGNTIQFKITDLDHISPNGLTWAQLSGGAGGTSPPPPPPPPPPVSPPPPADGQVITANDTPGQQLTGGAGNDTLNAGHNSVVETGGGGADVFAFGDTPWNAGHITDFTLGTDRLDLSALFRASGYSGADPVADGFVSLVANGSGGTKVLYDTDGHGSGNTIQFTITDLDHVSPNGLTWAQLSSGAGGTSPPPPPPPPPPPADGQSIRGGDTPGQALTGGAGNDTLTAGHNSVVETGAGGADRFVFDALPWNAGHITDFASGADHIDLSQLLAASHYAGTDPFADGFVHLAADGHGGTQVLYDTDGPGSGNTIQFLITTVDHVTPGQLGAGDFIFH